MKKHLLAFVVLLLAAVVGGYCYLSYRWKHLWAQEVPKQVYPVLHYHDDTLRIIMIGDSWAGMRTDNLNNSFQKRFTLLYGNNVIVKSKGRGGEKSRGIYQLMFETDDYGTRTLLANGADYCVIFAGINDAATNKGVHQYIYHYRLILDFLLKNKIRPVVVEIPNVNLWGLYKEKPIKDLLGDYLKSMMTGCDIYNYKEYREALLSMLTEEGMTKEIVFVPMKDWNGDGESINESLFLEDQIHLNRRGYELLDSCIALKIMEDHKNR